MILTWLLLGRVDVFEREEVFEDEKIIERKGVLEDSEEEMKN